MNWQAVGLTVLLTVGMLNAPAPWDVLLGLFAMLAASQIEEER